MVRGVSSRKPSTVLHAVDPFAVYVGDRDGACTLLDIATTRAHVPLSELRALNPALDDVAADALLPSDTVVRLPVRLAQHGHGECGLPFVLGEAESRLRRCEAALDALLAARPAPCAVPVRRVRSRTEQMIEVLHTEARRQLPTIERAMHEEGWTERVLHLMLDVDATRAAETAIERDFAAVTAKLQSYKPQYATLLCHPSNAVMSENYLTAATLQTTTDQEEDFCVEHTHRWEFVFCAPRSMEVQDGWAVLGCQKLTALLDAFACVNDMAPFATGVARKNAFLFIHGVFYVDDRHRDEPGYEDLSSAVRHFDPVRVAGTATGDSTTEDGNDNDDGREGCGTGHGGVALDPQYLNPVFGRCPVRSAAETTFAELRLKSGQMCVLRHLNECDHYFYLSGVRSLRGYTRVERDAFPHRVLKRKDRILRCHLCHKFPATVALYGDALSSHDPALYCVVCHEILHGGSSTSGATDFLKVEPEHVGDYFTY